MMSLMFLCHWIVVRPHLSMCTYLTTVLVKGVKYSCSDILCMIVHGMLCISCDCKWLSVYIETIVQCCEKYSDPIFMHLKRDT